ncbi:MAG TPA: TolC family protein, partial [Bacteroidales bacterium]
STTGLYEPIPIQYAASPVLNIKLDQPLFAYNSMKWDRKIQPLMYEEARKNYLDAMEQVSLRALGRFFDLALAQLNVRIAQVNFSNSDTLYKIAKGRYNIGTIAENDVLQMQLAYLNAKTSLTKAEVDLEFQKSRLRSYLGYSEKVDFELKLPDQIPALEVDFQKVIDLAMVNNADIVIWNRRLIEAKRDVAQAKGQRRTINLSASYGLNKSTENDLLPVYQNPGESRGLTIGVGIPLLDWGQGRGRVKMAQSNMELTKVQIQQEQTDFEQNIYLQVMQFNLQDDQVVIAAKSDTIGQKRYDVTKQRFLIGKIDVLNLNDALKEKDSAKRGYISALRDYWNYFYTLRELTLYDFISNQPLLEEFDRLVNN